jgi:hypothetical protein
LRSAANSPSAVSLRRRSSKTAMSAPMPAGSNDSTTIWYFDEPGKVVIRPVAITSIPSSGLMRSREKEPFQITASMRALWSFRQK